MPRKRYMDRTYGEKVIRLFANLLVAGHPHSLTELPQILNCSKQTVTRIVRAIETSYQVEIERVARGREALYGIRSRKPPPKTYLSEDEMNVLWMCRALRRGFSASNCFRNPKML